ncbi:MAG: aldo/keto reductase [Methylobacterium sp.]|nr:aldo/keto reductase [Methylobacterium sp.]MCA3650826.1 aldo/keto reductase [Methylobacterium sp.]MCA4923429.1 aldo/keto reductase [Methylobacterium sp.]
MRMKSLGRSGLMVSEIGFGAAPIGDLYALLDDEAAIAAVVAAVEAGMTLIDTAPLYGHGLSEHRIGTAIRRLGQEKLVLSTKVGRVMSPARGAWDREGYAGGLPFAATLDYSHDGALRSLEQSLLRLGTDRIDIALIHDLDRRNHGDALDRHVETAIAGAYRALARLRDEGVVRAIGLGVNEAEICLRLAERCDIDCVLLAGRYTLLDHSAAEVFLPLAEARGIGVMLGGVFNSGILATGAIPGARYDYAEAGPDIRSRVERIAAICAEHRVALPVAAMHFARAHPAVSSVVLGAVDPREVERNLAGWAAEVPASLWADLAAAGLIPAAVEP